MRVLSAVLAAWIKLKWTAAQPPRHQLASSSALGTATTGSPVRIPTPWGCVSPSLIAGVAPLTATALPPAFVSCCKLFAACLDKHLISCDSSTLLLSSSSRTAVEETLIKIELSRIKLLARLRMAVTISEVSSLPGWRCSLRKLRVAEALYVWKDPRQSWKLP